MNIKRFLDRGQDRRAEYVSPRCELRPMVGGEWVCTSQFVALDDYVIRENELDW